MTIVLFKCQIPECTSCLDYNETAQRGICSACIPGYAVIGEVCLLAACNNSVIDSPEECDDGNNADSDGCSSLCVKETDAFCIGAGPGSCAICGNGSKDSPEECDDGNLSPTTDGCKANCTIDSGWNCTTVPGFASVCTLCNNSVVEVAHEQCDDGNKSDLDGCSSTC